MSSRQSPSLLDLPLETIYEIILHLGGGQIKLNANKLGCEAADVSVFVVNKYLPHFKDIISLSTTCIFLRKLLGSCIFTHVSLVRKDQTDAILSTPPAAGSRRNSKEKEYHRQLIREVLERGFRECSNSELARKSYRADESFKSRYDSFSMNNFVEYIEGGRELFSEDMKYFPNVKTLKVLDSTFNETYGTPTSDQKLLLLKNIPSNLTYLSLNIINLDLVKDIIPLVRRLDLFIDFNEIEKYHLKELSTIFKGKCTIKECNLFVSRDSCIVHTSFLELIDDMCGKNLDKLSIRVVKRSIREDFFSRSDYWADESIEESSYCGNWFVSSLCKSTNLKLLTIDVGIISYLKFSGEPIPNYIPRKEFTFMIVHPTLILPDFGRTLRHKICLMIQLLGVSNISLQYGDPLSQSDLTALRLITHFVSHLKSYDVYLKHVAIEQCWSTREETVLRDHIRDAITSGDRKKIQLFQPWGSLTFNSPKFRRPTSAQVVYENNDIKFRFDHSSPNEVSDNFWMAEASLLELEQYTRGISPRPVNTISDQTPLILSSGRSKLLSLSRLQQDI